MHLKQVYIFSNMTAREAQSKVNDMIRQYDDENTTVNFDLKIENSIAAGAFAETRYTVIIYIFSLLMGELYADS